MSEKNDSKFYFQCNEDGKFMGQGKCQRCQITNVLLYPKNSTGIKPPKWKPSEHPYFIDGEWQIRESDSAEKKRLESVDGNGIRIYDKKGNLKTESMLLSDAIKKAKRAQIEALEAEALELRSTAEEKNIVKGMTPTQKARYEEIKILKSEIKK